MTADSDVVPKAVDATSAMMVEVDKAISILNRVREDLDAKNGLFIDHRHSIVLIGIARNALNAAVETAKSTKWPVAADFPEEESPNALWQ